MLLVRLPTLGDGPEHWERLSRLWQLSKRDRVNIRFDFSGCAFLGQNAVAFLGGLARLILQRGGQVSFAWDTRRDAVAANLAQNGFMSAFSGPRRPWSGNSIPYREDPQHDPYGFERYLTQLWLGRGWVNVSARLSEAIVGNMAEVYLNAFDHAHSPTGVFACGQHYPNIKELSLAIVDFGVGIPSNVRMFHARHYAPEELSAVSCMKWAFQS